MVEDGLLLLLGKGGVLCDGGDEVGITELAEVLGRVGAEEKAVGPHRLGRPGEEAPGHRVGRLVGADVVLQGGQVEPDVGQGQGGQAVGHLAQLGLLGGEQVADHELHPGVALDEAAQRLDLAAGAAQLANIQDEHQAVLVGKGGFPLHHVSVQGKDRVGGHQPRAGADLEFHHPQAQLLEQMPDDAVAVAAAGVIGPGGQKALGPLLLGLPAVQVLKAEVSALQQDGPLHAVLVHDLQDALGGGLVGVPFGRQQLAGGAVGVHSAALPAAAQLASRAGAGNALHQMDMGVDDLHKGMLLSCFSTSIQQERPDFQSRSLRVPDGRRPRLTGRMPDVYNDGRKQRAGENVMRKNRGYWGGPLAAAVVLVLLVSLAGFLVTERVNRQEEQASFDRLAEEADKMARSIEAMVDSDREKLTLLARLLAMGVGEREDFLVLYQGTGTFFSRLEVLLPGDQVVTAGGLWTSAAGKLSFRQEAALGAHISDRELDLDGEGQVVRHYVPVVRQGETVAMLCGVIELGSLVQELPYKPYGGQAAVYLIDGATGDFLIDTWHTGEEPGNIWALGSRPMAEGYNVWMIGYVRRQTGEKQRQLDALNYIYEVEKLLFDAHQHRENIVRSLEVTGRMLAARRVAFAMAGDEAGGYLWEQDGRTGLGAALLESAPALMDRFAGGGAEITAHSPQEVREILPCAPEEMKDLTAIPVEDGSGALRGVLAASGLPGRKDCVALLRSVGFSYAKLWDNARTYQEMQRQGTEDALTGLYNRNRYQQDLSRLAAEGRQELCCIFVDVNGLHELNNTQGHRAGDQMLQEVARQIRQSFGDRWSYRVGGDEFVVFAVDQDRQDLQRRCQAATEALKQKGYYISAGMAWTPAPAGDLGPLLEDAERRMYEAKRLFYQDPRFNRRAR